MEGKNGIYILIAFLLGFIILMTVISEVGKRRSLDKIKNKTVGHGQHGNARFATPAEVKEMYQKVPFEPQAWRRGQNLPTVQGIIVGSIDSFGRTAAYVDSGDVHAMVDGASGTGRTSFFLYPNLEYLNGEDPIEKDTDKAAQYFQKAADKNNQYAQYQLAKFHLVGNQGEQTPKEKPTLQKQSDNPLRVD